MEAPGVEAHQAGEGGPFGGLFDQAQAAGCRAGALLEASAPATTATPMVREDYR